MNKIIYSEPAEYFPEDISKQCKLGKYAEDGQPESVQTVTFPYEAALRKAKALNKSVNHCMEYTDAYVFSDSNDIGIGGNGSVVIMKETGEAVNMTFYGDTSEGTFVKEVDI